jgi:hypothetical protein
MMPLPNDLKTQSLNNSLAPITTFWAAPDQMLFDQRTIALILSCSEATLERNRWLGIGLPFVKMGRTVCYKKADVVAYLNNHSDFSSTSKAQKAQVEVENA